MNNDIQLSMILEMNKQRKSAFLSYEEIMKMKKGKAKTKK
jgi:hypothetical protein